MSNSNKMKKGICFNILIAFVTLIAVITLIQPIAAYSNNSLYNGSSSLTNELISSYPNYTVSLVNFSRNLSVTATSLTNAYMNFSFMETSSYGIGAYFNNITTMSTSSIPTLTSGDGTWAGMRILTHDNIILKNVTVGPGDESTRCNITDDNKVTLVSSTTVSNRNFTFDYKLAAGKYYRIVCQGGIMAYDGNAFAKVPGYSVDLTDGIYADIQNLGHWRLGSIKIEKDYVNATVYVGNTIIYNNYITNNSNFSLLQNRTNVSTSLTGYINSYLSTCTYSGSTCQVPINFTFDGRGFINYSDLNFDDYSFNINITYPINNFNYSTSISAINYTFSSGISYCWYSKNNGITNSSPVSAGINFTGVTFAENKNNLTLYCNDSANVINSTSINFTIDTLPPVVSYGPTTLADNALVSQSYIPVEVLVTESNLKNITYLFYDSTQTLIGGYTETYLIANYSINKTVPDGTYYYNVTVGDFAGWSTGIVSRKITLDTTLDTTPPVLSFVSPGVTSSTSYKIITNIPVNISIIEPNLQTASIYLSNSSGYLLQTLSTVTNGSFFVNFTSLDYGTYYINGSAMDIFGLNTSTSVLTIKLTPWGSDVDSCMDLSVAGGLYTLNTSITNNALVAPCITINANDITLDCQNYFISSDDNYAAIYIDGATGIKLNNCNLSMGATGSGIQMNGGDAIVSDTYAHDEGDDIFLQGASSLTCINCNYSSERFTGAAAKLTRQWRYRAKVVDNTLNPIDIARVSIANSSNSIVYNLGTDSTGYTPRIAITEYTNDGVDTSYPGPYNVTGSRESFPSKSQSYDAASNREDTIILSIEIASPLSRIAMQLILGIILVVGLITSISFFVYKMGNSNYTSDMWKYFIIMVIWLVLFLVLFLVLSNYIMLYLYPKV